MFPVFIHSDPMKVNLARLVLECEGIACFVKNEHTTVFVVGNFGPIILRFPFCDPDLCVLYEEDVAPALKLIKEFKSDSSGADWQCSQCQEMVPHSFDQCWNCSHDPTINPQSP